MIHTATNATSRLPSVMNAKVRLLEYLVSGRTAWERPAMLLLLLLTGLLYCWGLDLNGWANAYYSAAVMSASQDWTAFLYGASDPANAITVDKPPMSIWVMALSVRVFGLNSWSILLPQAVMGIGCVYLLYILARRFLGAPIALLAATLMAVTPVSTVMFRYNNPDALLILLMVAGTLAVTSAIEKQRAWLMAVAGFAVGAGFLTKQLQIGLILPAFVITYFAYAKVSLPRRILHQCYLAAGAAAAAGPWLAVVAFTDPASRPFIGGSRTNSAVELALGYNGLQRLTGEDAMRTTPTDMLDNSYTGGFQRFLEPQFSGQFGWLLPFALAGLSLGTVWVVKKQVNAGTRVLLLLSGVWFSTAVTVLAFMSGIVHPYYCLTAVPPLCILAAVGFWSLHKSRTRKSKILMLITLLATTTMAYVSALRSTSELPGLPQILLALWAIAIALQFVPTAARSGTPMVVTSVLVGVLISGPILWSVNTVLSPHVGAGVMAGPSILGYRNDYPGGEQISPQVSPAQAALILGNSPPPSLMGAIEETPSTVTWITATIGGETAANYQLELGRPVLPVGGFDGTDPFPSLEQFQVLVAKGKVGSLVIHELPPMTVEGKGESARIVGWVRQNFAAQAIGGVEFYALRQ